MRLCHKHRKEYGYNFTYAPKRLPILAFRYFIRSINGYETPKYWRKYIASHKDLPAYKARRLAGNIRWRLNNPHTYRISYMRNSKKYNSEHYWRYGIRCKLPEADPQLLEEMAAPDKWYNEHR